MRMLTRNFSSVDEGDVNKATRPFLLLRLRNDKDATTMRAIVNIKNTVFWGTIFINELTILSLMESMKFPKIIMTVSRR